MLDRISWAEYRYDIVSGDLTTNVALSWRTSSGWSKSTLPTSEVYPRRTVRILEVYGLLTDGVGPNLRDGALVTIGELGPRPTSLVEWVNKIQTPEDRAWLWFPGGMPVDIGVCFHLAVGAHQVAGDRLYAFIKYLEAE